MSPVRAALRNLLSLCRPYRAHIRVFQIPGAYESVSKPHSILMKARRAVQLCAHKPCCINCL